ncbi:MAG: Na/Pi symporter [Thermoplasmatota archaeon]
MPRKKRPVSMINGNGKVRPEWRYQRRSKIQQIRESQWFNLLLFFLSIYVFIIGLKLMGSGLKGMGKDFSESLITTVENPFVGLAIGVLATAVIQSSSATTSMVVLLVADDPSFFPYAIPIIIGANIGTSVTNIIVSLGHIRHPPSFKRAFSGALVHDFFNLFAAGLIFPAEQLVRIFTGKGILERLGEGAANLLVGTGGFEFDLIDRMLDPVLTPTKDMILDLGFYPEIMLLVVGLVILFVSLSMITKSARRAIEGKVQKVVDRVLFRNAGTSFGFGVGLTSFVQSSSVTTSLVVPLVGSGILTVEQIFPYTLGANVGTTVTALLAAVAAGMGKMALAISLVHLFFNMIGIVILYPMRKAPIWLAKKAAVYFADNRKFTILFILGLFFVLPGLIILLDRLVF